MKKSNIEDKSLRQRLNRPPRLTIVDQNRMKRLVDTQLRWWKIIVVLFAILLLAAIISGIIWLAVPPSDSSAPTSSERSELIQTAMRMDSITAELNRKEKYTRNIVALLQNDLPALPEQTPDSVRKGMPVDSLIAISQTERDFIAAYEQRQALDAAVISPVDAKGIYFANPFQGAEARQPEKGEDNRRVTFDMNALQPVTAAYRGTVLDVYNTLSDGFNVIILHPGQFITRYSGLTDVSVRRGQTVQTAQNIGMVDRDKAERFGAQPALELWHADTPVDPRNYIPF